MVSGGAVHVTDHAVAAHVGRGSLFNRATALDPEQPDVALGEVERFFGSRPHSIWLAQVDDDQALRDELVSRGYHEMSPQHGMARLEPVAASEVETPARPELVADVSRAAEIADVVASGYGLRPDDRLVLEDISRAVLRHAKPFDNGALYAVEVDGRYVAAGLLLCTPGHAGLAGVATLAGHRHRGYATAICLRALHDAAAQGFPVGVTLSSPDTEPLLTRLGFRTVLAYRVYRRATA